MIGTPLTRETLGNLLGTVPNTAPVGKTENGSETIDGIRVSRLEIGPSGIPAVCLAPEGTGPMSGLGILYCHAHGGAYDIGKAEATHGRPALIDPPLGLALAREGAVVLCPDMTGFGERQCDGSESALSKAAHWNGRSLLGQMVDDLSPGHAILADHPGVDRRRIVTLGISMGGTLAYLYAALHPEIAACVQLCVFADIAPMIETGAHDRHGAYMTIPGLLPAHDMSAIAAMVAPRPQFVATGGADPLCPDRAYEPAIATLRKAYKDAPDRLVILRNPDAGHHETPEMRRAVMDFLQGVA